MDDSDYHDHFVKMVLLGDSDTGKTCFLERFMGNEFPKNRLTTIGVDHKQRMFRLDDGKIAKLQIWDTAGQERFKSLSKIYYRDADAIILMFDVNNRESFVNLDRWLLRIKTEAPKNIQVLLVGNKIDLKERFINTEEAEDLAKKNNLTYIESSAKDNINIERGFNEIITKVVKLGIIQEDNLSTKLISSNNKKSSCC